MQFEAPQRAKFCEILQGKKTHPQKIFSPKKWTGKQPNFKSMQQTQNQTAAIPKKAKKQISKYQRKPKEVSRVIIQPRDAEIIKLAYDRASAPVIIIFRFFP